MQDTERCNRWQWNLNVSKLNSCGVDCARCNCEAACQSPLKGNDDRRVSSKSFEYQAKRKDEQGPTKQVKETCRTFLLNRRSSSKFQQNVEKRNGRWRCAKASRQIGYWNNKSIKGTEAEESQELKRSSRTETRIVSRYEFRSPPYEYDILHSFQDIARGHRGSWIMKVGHSWWALLESTMLILLRRILPSIPLPWTRAIVPDAGVAEGTSKLINFILEGTTELGLERCFWRKARWVNVVHLGQGFLRPVFGILEECCFRIFEWYW